MRISDWSSDVCSSDRFLFKPRSVALIGASRRPRSVGAVLARNLFDGGFDGPVMPVNPRERSIESALSYAAIDALPMTPDLAVVSTPPPTVPDLIAELGRRGTKAAVVRSEEHTSELQSLMRLSYAV